MNVKKRFFSTIEKQISAVPSYLQVLLTRSCYDNFLSLSLLDDDDFKEMEELCKSDFGIMQLAKTDYDLYYKQKTLAALKFKNGHKKLLLGIRNTILDKSVAYFNNLLLADDNKFIKLTVPHEYVNRKIQNIRKQLIRKWSQMEEKNE
jgi:hypothetical protein